MSQFQGNEQILNIYCTKLFYKLFLHTADKTQTHMPCKYWYYYECHNYYCYYFYYYWIISLNRPVFHNNTNSTKKI